MLCEFCQKLTLVNNWYFHHTRYFPYNVITCPSVTTSSSYPVQKYPFFVTFLLVYRWFHQLPRFAAAAKNLQCLCQCQCQSWIYIAHKRKASNTIDDHDDDDTEACIRVILLSSVFASVLTQRNTILCSLLCIGFLASVLFDWFKLLTNRLMCVYIVCLLSVPVYFWCYAALMTN